jgi:predicted SAM-dependent methyltransferase
VALILNTHLIEHFHKDDAILALKEWYRILKPGGWLITEAPDINKCMDIIVNNPNPEEKFQAMCGVYGLNWYNIYMAHLWGYTEETMIKILIDIGFTYVVSNDPEQHRGKTHNFRVDAKK